MNLGHYEECLFAGRLTRQRPALRSGIIKTGGLQDGPNGCRKYAGSTGRSQ